MEESITFRLTGNGRGKLDFSLLAKILIRVRLFQIVTKCHVTRRQEISWLAERLLIYQYGTWSKNSARCPSGCLSVSYLSICLEYCPHSRFLHASYCSGRFLDSRLERYVNVFSALINFHFPSGAIMSRLMMNCRLWSRCMFHIMIVEKSVWSYMILCTKQPLKPM
jgi:hypothetical protein